MIFPPTVDKFTNNHSVLRNNYIFVGRQKDHFHIYTQRGEEKMKKKYKEEYEEEGEEEGKESYEKNHTRNEILESRRRRGVGLEGRGYKSVQSEC